MICQLECTENTTKNYPNRYLVDCSCAKED